MSFLGIGQHNAIIESLRRGKDELLRDNAAIETEKASMWSLMGELEKHVYPARGLGDAVDNAKAYLATRRAPELGA